MINLLEDGYVRLTLQSFKATTFVHFLSGLDDDCPTFSHEGGTPARIAGYTEWLSLSAPIITIGWDWCLDVSQGKVAYVRLGAPRCNVMFVDESQCDIQSARTLELLESEIDKFSWREEVHKRITARYV